MRLNRGDLLLGGRISVHKVVARHGAAGGLEACDIGSGIRVDVDREPSVLLGDLGELDDREGLEPSGKLAQVGKCSRVVDLCAVR